MGKYYWILKFCIILLISMVYAEINGKAAPVQCRRQFRFTGTKGDIYSPLYDKGEYPPGLRCEYKITAPLFYRLKLTFVDVDIYGYHFCTDSSLIVNAKTNGPELARICGKDRPEPIITDPRVNVVTIIFNTGTLGTGRGFHIHYDAALSFDNCEKGKIQCNNRKCFDPVSEKCNGVDNCGDGTDEEGCNLPLIESECGKPAIEPDTIFRDRVVGGQEVIPGSWPWQISMQARDITNSHRCGGTLINSQWVLTAANCLMYSLQASYWRIHIGKHHKYYTDKNEQIRYVDKILIFPDETGKSLDGAFDINNAALIKLNAPVQFSDYVRPACLPEPNQELEPNVTKCYSTGWGETRGTGSDDVLKQTHMTILSRSDCVHHEQIQICGRNHEEKTSTCQGDSGGPLSCFIDGKWYVMGAVSHSTDFTGLTVLCGLIDLQTVFMKTSAKVDWIKSVIDKFS